MLFVGRFPLISSAITKLLTVLKVPDNLTGLFDILSCLGATFIVLAMLTLVADISIVPLNTLNNSSKLKSGLIAFVISLLNLIVGFNLKTTNLIDILWISMAILFCIIVGIKSFIERPNKF